MKKIIIISILVLMLAGAFYWWEIRPFLAYKECGNYASEKYSKIVESSAFKSATDVRLALDFYEEAFKSCLRKKGINK